MHEILRNLARPMMSDSNLTPIDILDMSSAVGLENIIIINLDSVQFHTLSYPDARLLVEVTVKGLRSEDINKYVWNNLPYNLEISQEVFDVIVSAIVVTIKPFMNDGLFLTPLGWRNDTFNLTLYVIKTRM